MASASLSKIVSHCDRLLQTADIEDYKGAVNGLQVENGGKVSRIAAAVDASLATARMAVDAGADLLIVHHGLFWGPTTPWTGKKRELIRTLLSNNLAVYSSHLPLDMHPVHGNNAGLAKALGLKQPKTFFPYKGRDVGMKFSTSIRRDALLKKLGKATGAEPTVIPGGPATCRRIGIVTGGAGGEIAEAAKAGVDTFITGEGPHWSYALAEELEINVLYAGHYASETFGVKSLSEHLSRKFKLPWSFLDHPTGL